MQAIVKGAMFLSSQGGTFDNDRGETIQWAKAEWFSDDKENAGTVTLGLDTLINPETLEAGKKYDLTIVIRNQRIDTKNGQRTVCRGTVIAAVPSR